LYEINVLLQNTLAIIIGTLLLNTFCNLLFQDNRSESFPIMPDEFGEHLTRDQRPFLHIESLQILQIHKFMLVLLLFSSDHSSGQETGTVKTEASFCAQLPIFVLILMFVFDMAWHGPL